MRKLSIIIAPLLVSCSQDLPDITISIPSPVIPIPTVDLDASIPEASTLPCVLGETITCYTGPTSSPLGECKAGISVCGVDSVYGPCGGQLLPTQETCNQKDDDCDGIVDNFPLPPGFDEECMGYHSCTMGSATLPNGTNCSVGICVAGSCRPPHCWNQAQDGNETASDCGGSCRGCDNGQACKTNQDCMASYGCAGGKCEYMPPRCNDGIKNGDETDLDCGGPCRWEVPLCSPGKNCKEHADCQSQFCVVGVCQQQSTCVDGLKGPLEADVDCGGNCVANCPDGSSCLNDWDCQSGACLFAKCAPK